MNMKPQHCEHLSAGMVLRSTVTGRTVEVLNADSMSARVRPVGANVTTFIEADDLPLWELMERTISDDAGDQL